jgi:hypothetical protein
MRFSSIPALNYHLSLFVTGAQMSLPALPLLAKVHTDAHVLLAIHGSL